MDASPDGGLPRVESWELPQVYRRLKAAVIELENAWEEERLADAIEDPDLVSVVGHRVEEGYRRLLERGPAARSPFRRASIHAILEPLKDLLEPPRIVYPARSVPAPWNEPDAEARWSGAVGAAIRLAAVETEGPEGPCVLRLHQVISARSWGIGFEFEDPEDDAWLVNTLVRLATRRLGVDLNGLYRVGEWLSRQKRIREGVRIAPDAEGRRFEQLMLDVLNHASYRAKRAPLAEDFLEKTDLRVQTPGVVRRRGARVQVTQTVHPEQHSRKLARIRRVREFIILSPRSLAEALSGPGGEEILDRGELKALWDGLPAMPATIDDLARLMREAFLESYRTALDHPRGPAASLPFPLPELVNRFVDREAARATGELRDRESRRRR